MTHDELQTYLESIERQDWYRVHAVLKQDESTETQLVYYPNPDGTEKGPFIRKYMDLNLYDGKAYQHLYEQTRQGVRIPHVPAVLECYKTGTHLVVVTEYVAGDTLSEYVRKHGGSLDVARRFFPKICDAVSSLHGLNPPLIHRDLKPSNIVINGDDAYLIDFGIARLFTDGAESDTTHFGTRSYAPPEQFGFGQTDERADVYALGKILQFCVTGLAPNPGSAQSSTPEGVSSAVWKVIQRATSFDPANRYASAAQLKQAFLNPMIFAVMGSSPIENPNDTTVAGSLKMSGKALWNGLVIIAWIFMMSACVSAMVNPVPEQAAYPVPLRVFEYLGMAIIPITLACYLMLFRKGFRKRLPLVSAWPWWKELLIFAALALSLLFITYAICIGLVWILEIPIPA